jgi:predicted GTPase
LTTPLEGEAVGAAKRALKLAHVVILVVDASGGTSSGLEHGAATSTVPRAARAQDYTQGWGLTRQDMSIAEQILAEGRSLVIALNKMDTVDRAQHIIDHVQNQLDNMHQGQHTEIVPLSALTGQGKDLLLPVVARVHESWNKTISTSKLNNWIMLLSRHHPPPSTVRTRKLLTMRPSISPSPVTVTRGIILQ